MRDPGDDPISGEGDLVSCDCCGAERYATSDADAEEPMCEFCRGDAYCVEPGCRARAPKRVKDSDEPRCDAHLIAWLAGEAGVEIETEASWDGDGRLVRTLAEPTKGGHNWEYEKR